MLRRFAAFFFILAADYELIDESRMDSKMQQNPEMMLCRVTAGSRTRFRCARIGRKLPRTPEEYAEVSRKTPEPPLNADNVMAPYATNQLKPTHTQQNLCPPPLDNVSASFTLLNAHENGEGTSGCPEHIRVLHSNSKKGVKRWRSLPTESTRSACCAIKSHDVEGDYEKLNPETMDSCQGSGTTGYEKLNRATQEPQKPQWPW